MTAREYHPIDCALHDQLEAKATLGQPVSITYRGEDGREVTVDDRIVDIVSRSGVEFVKLEEGSEVRLDDLVTVAGIPFGSGEASTG